MSGNDRTDLGAPSGQSMAEILQQALRMTEKLAHGALEVDQISAMLDERALLIENVTEARQRGDEWTAREMGLVSRLQALDEQIVSGVWAQRKDSFEWLAQRSPDAVKDMPLLRELAQR